VGRRFAAEAAPPFNYLLTFNIAGLTNEYDESPVFCVTASRHWCRRWMNWKRSTFRRPWAGLEAFHHRGRRLDRAVDLCWQAENLPKQERSATPASSFSCGLLRPGTVAYRPGAGQRGRGRAP